MSLLNNINSKFWDHNHYISFNFEIYEASSLYLITDVKFGYTVSLFHRIKNFLNSLCFMRKNTVFLIFKINFVVVFLLRPRAQCKIKSRNISKS
jgi:hypothetical protein